MNRGSEVRQTLMSSAIRVVSVQGIQNATTKALSIESGLSEVYIYRYFERKDDLLRQTFYSLDKELMYLMKKSFLKIIQEDANVKLGFRLLFHDFWKFTLRDKDKCSFFIQYYYSSFYSPRYDIDRKSIYQPLLDLISPAFVENTDPWLELNHMYDVVFPKLLRVIRGSLPDNKETETSIYQEIVLIEENKMRWNTKLSNSLTNIERKCKSTEILQGNKNEQRRSGSYSS